MSGASADDDLLAFKSSWKKPTPKLTLRGPDSLEVSNGSLVRYGLETDVEAYCYVVRLDARGDAWLWGGEACAPGTDPVGKRTLLPSDSAMELQSAIGRESLRAFLVPEPINFDTSGSESAWIALESDSLTEITNQLKNAADAGNLAVASLDYEVLEDSGGLQFTTRAILEQVANSLETGTGEGVVGTYSVDAIRFEFGTAQPTPSGIRQMNAFGEALQDPMLADKRVVIAGHTDDVGSGEFNMELSRARSQAVKDYFNENFGVDPARVETQAFGESRPVVPNDNEGNRAKNRRVEITFLY